MSLVRIVEVAVSIRVRIHLQILLEALLLSKYCFSSILAEHVKGFRFLEDHLALLDDNIKLTKMDFVDSLNSKLDVLRNSLLQVPNCVESALGCPQHSLPDLTEEAAGSHYLLSLPQYLFSACLQIIILVVLHMHHTDHEAGQTQQEFLLKGQNLLFNNLKKLLLADDGREGVKVEKSAIEEANVFTPAHLVLSLHYVDLAHEDGFVGVQGHPVDSRQVRVQALSESLGYLLHLVFRKGHALVVVDAEVEVAEAVVQIDPLVGGFELLYNLVKLLGEDLLLLFQLLLVDWVLCLRTV